MDEARDRAMPLERLEQSANPPAGSREMTVSEMQREIGYLLRTVKKLVEENSRIRDEFCHHSHLDGNVVQKVMRY